MFPRFLKLLGEPILLNNFEKIVLLCTAKLPELIYSSVLDFSCENCLTT